MIAHLLGLAFFIANLGGDKGLARTIYPVHTPSDGDSIFALGIGTREGGVGISVVGALAAEVVSEAVISAIRQAKSIPGFPAASDFNP